MFVYSLTKHTSCITVQTIVKPQPVSTAVYLDYRQGVGRGGKSTLVGVSGYLANLTIEFEEMLSNISDLRILTTKSTGVMGWTVLSTVIMSPFSQLW